MSPNQNKVIARLREALFIRCAVNHNEVLDLNQIARHAQEADTAARLASEIWELRDDTTTTSNDPVADHLEDGLSAFMNGFGLLAPLNNQNKDGFKS